MATNMGLPKLLQPSKKKVQKDSVIAIFESLRKNRVQLHLTEPKCDQVLTFLISKIEPAKNTIELLSLLPDTTLPPSGDISYSLATLPNSTQNMAFSTQLLGSKNEGLDIFYFQLPETVENIEQRLTRRTSVSINQHFQIIINDIDDEPLLGRLEDISTAGMKASFDGDLREKLQPSEMQRLCNIEQENGLQMEHQLEIVYVRYNGVSKSSTVGCQFVEIDETQNRELFTFISGLHLKQYHKYL